MENNKLRVSIQQPSLPTYRKPLYEELSERFQLSIFYGSDDVPEKLPQINNLFYERLIVIDLGKIKVKWHLGQIKAFKNKFDVTIISWDVQYLSLWICLIKKILLRQPLVLWGHGFSKSENRIKRLIRNIPAFFSDAILLYDYNTASFLSQKKRLKNKVFVAPNSIDQSVIQTEKVKWSNDKLLEFKEKEQINDSFNLIYIGRIYKENNLEILLKTFSQLKDNIPEINLIIIGKGDSEYQNELNLLTQELKINNFVKWLGAIYNESQIAPWMLASDVFCYPQNIGLSIIHAFGYGLPVVTNDNMSAHNPEVWSLSNNENGILYQDGNVESFAESIFKLYKDSKLRESLSENAVKTVESKFTINLMADGFEKAIKSVLKK